MSDIKKIKDEFLHKLSADLNIESVNQIKSELPTLQIIRNQIPDITDFYIGYVGIKPNDFWINTFKENILISESFFIKNNLKWEQTRFVASMIHNVNCSKKSQMLKPHDLIELPQDKVKKIKPKTSKKEFEKYQELINSKLNKN